MRLDPRSAVHRILHFRPLPNGDLKAAEPQMAGKDVIAVQKAHNKRAKDPARGLTVLVVDGICGRQFIAQTRKDSRSLGRPTSTTHGLDRRAQTIIRYPWLRTPAERKRERTWLIRQAAARKAAAAEAARSTVKIDGNHATGGRTKRARLVGVIMAACTAYYSGKRIPVFYDQNGLWDPNHAITGEPRTSRSDCSSLDIAFHRSAGLPDPARTDFMWGNTDTLKGAGREITRQQLKQGDDIIYCYANGSSHHVEKYVGNADGKTTYFELAAANSPYRDRTVGHGSPPVDFGDIDMIAGARFFRPFGLD